MITRRAFVRGSAGTAAGLILPTWLVKAENYIDIEATKQFLLGYGFTIIQYSDRYFDFMKDNRFGHFTVATHFGYSLSSSYKPSREHGTGCQVASDAFAFSLTAFESALNNTAHCRGDGPAFYRDLEQRIDQHWAKKNPDFKIHYPGDQ